ncbi:S8 family peptidase [Parvularcula lutaonensis]|uniref:S8 family peptidase n=1 Tax=Parvularcula lutaonensis TaxID=491923 RepID=A0ABV7MCJ2_9PROT|nr:S8 family peptidase [Parvularcula lutaonensis]GGY37965.1 hypothetical protein GCM10007148_02790 [Parvularcula lutaonensis]
MVGLLDMRIAQTDHNIEYLTNIGGYTNDTNPHGAAVASLIGARHDGQGVMGIAPTASVLAYNPFDDTGTTNPDAVREGLLALVNGGASVINMSLGVPGSTFDQSIADIFNSPDFSLAGRSALMVFAAGNEGVTQTGDVILGGSAFSTRNLLIVGSVDPTGTISSFSNRPGGACFVSTAGTCAEGDRLMDRFLVAPGELLLVSDNNGGTARATGTSFAAPLVTGTVALMQDFWPWLQRNPEATAEIILATARDLGDPGVDAVYGHGLLDVEAAVSPIDFSDLHIYLDELGNYGYSYTNSVSLATAIMTPGVLDLWEANGASIIAFERTAGTFRDFAIPLSTLLHGNSSMHLAGERFQRHVTDRLIAWADTMVTSTTDDASGVLGGSVFFSFTSQEGDVEVLSGQGLGSHHLSAINPTASSTDYHAETGGTNPLLGLASGGSFGRLTVKTPGDLTLSLGMSATAFDQRVADPATGDFLAENPLFGSRDAAATYAEIAWAPSERLSIGVGFTGLVEENAVLGAQGAGILSMENGAATGALTLTGRYELAPTLSLTASATGARTTSLDDQRALAIAKDGLLSSAMQFTITKDQIFGKRDRLRASVMQPMHVEAGDVAYTSVQVTDRLSGTTGKVTDHWALGSSARHLAAEAEYGFGLAGDAVRMSAFTRYDQNVVDSFGRYDALSFGSKLTISY